MNKETAYKDGFTDGSNNYPKFTGDKIGFEHKYQLGWLTGQQNFLWSLRRYAANLSYTIAKDIDRELE